jgi:SPP1 family phage portal protein
MQTGRIVIYTDVKEVTKENVISVLRSAILEHDQNSARIQFLLDYDAGIQPLQRTKKTRTDIDCRCVDNVANEVTEFNLGFKWGNPITFVQNGDESNKNITKAIAELNTCYQSQGYNQKQQELARYIEICGVGYVYIDVNTEYEDGDSYFTYDVLDPRITFVVRSTYYSDRRIILAGTYRKEKNTGKRFYTCFTKDQRFEITDGLKITNGKNEEKNKWGFLERSGEENPLHKIPIVEYVRSYDRMGCFERQISEMDNLNLLVSDFTNDVDQNTQAIWHGNDVEFPKEIIEDENGKKVEVTKKPGTNEWILTYTSQDGKQPFINPLAVQYDYSGMLNNIQYRRQVILQKCNVPQRNDNSGGSTGVAMSDATGWSQAETAAAKQQLITDGCKMEEIKVVLEAIKQSSGIEANNPLLKLRSRDVQPNIKRQKTYEMSTKVNSIATLISHGFSLEDTIGAIPFFDDPNDVVSRSGEMVREYQDSVIKKDTTNQAEGGDGEKEPNKERTMQDLSDQIENSPMIDKSRTDR